MKNTNNLNITTKGYRSNDSMLSYSHALAQVRVRANLARSLPIKPYSWHTKRYSISLLNPFLGTPRNVRFVSSSLQNNPFKKEESVLPAEKFNGSYTSNFINQLMQELFFVNQEKDVSNYEIQKRMEFIIFDQYDKFYSNNRLNYIKGIDANIMVPSFIKYILAKEDMVRSYIIRLKDSYQNKKKLLEKIYCL